MKVVFIDRDGVINKDVGYLDKIEDFQFIDGVFTSFRYLQSLGFSLVIITNQSGIGRGYFSDYDFHVVNNWMLDKFSHENVNILDVLYCPHKPLDLCTCRKPNTGMLETINKKYNIIKKESWLIGDKESDIDTAINFGITNTVLVESGQEIDKKNSKANFILPSIKFIDSCIT
ncbi:D-glycero-beta-D-manno-heptose 1,7-bisphosphate 7-phosphatase [Tenacibaculum xiamenense]|uniref:D-glycero-beta-D-manno-heptose 1,7-bisphosphate 7-phosphatase n=1 Tax=Tenacibaculum xiamenense TaxID=1261553 RepID=UPI003893E978